MPSAGLPLAVALIIKLPLAFISTILPSVCSPEAFAYSLHSTESAENLISLPADKVMLAFVLPETAEPLSTSIIIEPLSADISAVPFSSTCNPAARELLFIVNTISPFSLFNSMLEPLFTRTALISSFPLSASAIELTIISIPLSVLTVTNPVLSCLLPTKMP